MALAPMRACQVTAAYWQMRADRMARQAEADRALLALVAESQERARRQLFGEGCTYPERGSK
jgi:hypothetical protein